MARNTSICTVSKRSCRTYRYVAVGAPEDRRQREYDYQDRANGEDEVSPELEGVFFNGHSGLVCLAEWHNLDVIVRVANRMATVAGTATMPAIAFASCSPEVRENCIRNRCAASTKSFLLSLCRALAFRACGRSRIHLQIVEPPLNSPASCRPLSFRHVSATVPGACNRRWLDWRGSYPSACFRETNSPHQARAAQTKLGSRLPR